MFVGPPPLSLSCLHVARGWMSRQLWYWQVTIVDYWTSPQLCFPTNKTFKLWKEWIVSPDQEMSEVTVTSSLHSSILSAIIYTCHGIASKEAWISYSMFQHLLVENSTHLLKFKSFYSCLSWKQSKSWVMHKYAAQSGSLGLVTTRQEIFMCHYVLVVVVERP